MLNRMIHKRRVLTGLTNVLAGAGLFLILVPGATAQATGASLSVSPNSGVFEVGSLVDVSFLVDTGGQAVNAVNAEVQFPADKLQVVNPAASTSFITIWVTAPTYSNSDGTMQFQGGLPNPGIKTSAGVISTVTFRVTAAGKAVIKFAPSSQVLRNDGEGTNILSATGSAELSLKIPPPAGPIVTSTSHPDSNQWSNNPNVQLTWEAPEDAVGYSYSFDQNPKSVPDETIETTKTNADVKAATDGVWYFHLRAKNESWGGTTTYAVRIDTTPPAAFTPTLDPNLITVEQTALLRFLTTDAASGIDHYEVKQIDVSGTGQGDTLFIESISPYTIQRLSDGSYQFVVRAFDRAGNVTEGTTTLTVVAAGLPFFARVPFLRNPAVANIALVVLASLVLLFIGWLIIRRARLRSTFRHDLSKLEHDAQKKAADLQQEMQEIQEAENMFHQQVPPLAPPPPPSVPPPPPQPPPATPPNQPSRQ